MALVGRMTKDTTMRAVARRMLSLAGILRPSWWPIDPKILLMKPFPRPWSLHGQYERAVMVMTASRVLENDRVRQKKLNQEM